MTQNMINFELVLEYYLLSNNITVATIIQQSLFYARM